MEKTKVYFMRNIAPAFGVMCVCLLGAFFVYKGFYSGVPSIAVDLSAIAPAAGEETIHHNGTTYRVIDTNHIPVWNGKSFDRH